MSQIEDILMRRSFTKDEIIYLLSRTDKREVELLRDTAFEETTRVLGNKVYYRGIVEFSNICTQNCLYCGIRRDNPTPKRYWLDEEEILDCARWAAENGYGSIVLQSGERRDEKFISFVESCIREIKAQSRSSTLPDGLGITLSIGEQAASTYALWFAAGAHRYLLRIETSNPVLYRRIHPESQTFEDRVACLSTLKECGFQVGTGVMIGIPGQTIDDSAEDILFFASNDIDMIGMGPYINHPLTPMDSWGMREKNELLQLSLNMIAVARLVLRDVNIAATTALQAIVYNGRELGISYGASVVMPNLTPTEVRSHYQLYSGKPCINEGRGECRTCLQRRVESTGRVVGYNEWGDPKHFAVRNAEMMAS